MSCFSIDLTGEDEEEDVPDGPPRAASTPLPSRSPFSPQPGGSCRYSLESFPDSISRMPRCPLAFSTPSESLNSDFDEGTDPEWEEMRGDFVPLPRAPQLTRRRLRDEEYWFVASELATDMEVRDIIRVYLDEQAELPPTRRHRLERRVEELQELINEGEARRHQLLDEDLEELVGANAAPQTDEE